MPCTERSFILDSAVLKCRAGWDGGFCLKFFAGAVSIVFVF